MGAKKSKRKDEKPRICQACPATLPPRNGKRGRQYYCSFEHTGRQCALWGRALTQLMSLTTQIAENADPALGTGERAEHRTRLKLGGKIERRGHQARYCG